MDFKTALQTCLREKYADVKGRASRSEFWWFILFVVIVSMILGLVDTALFKPIAYQTGPLSAIFSLIVLIPTITVTARRLHDQNMSGWWQLLYLVPVVGFLVVLFFMIRKGTDGSNDYGPNPV